MKSPTLAALSALTLSSSLYAGAPSVVTTITDENQPEWGVAMAVRATQYSFESDDSSTTDVYPLFYYEGDRFYLRGDNGGIKLWESDKGGVNAVARYRFLDVPEEYDDSFRGGTVDMGLQAYLNLSEHSQLQFDVLSDRDGRMHSELRLAGDYRSGAWRLFPELELRFTGEKFNTRYYGLGTTDLDRGIEANASLKGRRHVYGNWHLETKGEVAWLGTEASNSPLIEDDVELSLYIGLGVFDEQLKPKKQLKAQSYWRISQQWGTSSDLQNMIFGAHDTESGADVRSTSIFYGHPLSDKLFGAPIEMYFTSGITHHYSSSVQDSSLEFAFGFKGYYTYDTPWRMRLGIAEGISYADSLTFYEETELEEKELSESKLLNYIDVTLDVNVGDILNRDNLEELWLGTGIHHRSGIYGTSSAFGDVSGGTNFSSVYLQWHGDF